MSLDALFSRRLLFAIGKGGVGKTTVASAIDAARAARRDGADLVVGLVQTDRQNDSEIVGSGAFDVVLSGDDHLYATSYDGRTAYVETGIDGRYVAPLDLTVEVGTDKDGRRTVGWTPSFRFIDTASVTPDSRSSSDSRLSSASASASTASSPALTRSPSCGSTRLTTFLATPSTPL